LEHYQS
jgi:Ras-related protein Rab-2A